MDTKKNQQLLFKAIEQGEPTQAQRALNEGADPSARDGDGIPALSLAAQLGQVECVKALIKAGAPLDATRADGKMTAACEAVSAGEWGTLRELLRAGANPNVPGAASPLERAIRRGARDMVKLILESGADPNYRQRDGRDCAMLAASVADAESLGLLIAAGADLSARDQAGRDAARWALETDSLECLRLLAQQGVDLSIKDVLGDSCLEVGRALDSGKCKSFLAAWEQEREIRSAAAAAGPAAARRM